MHPAGLTPGRRLVGDPVAGIPHGGYRWCVTSEYCRPSALALGFGGRFIRVIPDRDLVVVITSDAANHRGDAQNLVGEAIIPAVAD